MARCPRFVCAIALSLAAAGSPTPARAETQFPYQARVIADNVEVRCGPGTSFYVTGKVKREDTVTVCRHDHGGWFMIRPPAGSISWIEAELVRRSGERGVVALPPGRTERAIVYIGSQLSDEHSFYGRELSHGDEVTILGEKTLPGPLGPTRMLKIVPPAQEFRWVRGEFLVPQSQQVQQQLAADPYQIPPEHRERLAKTTPPAQLTPPPAHRSDATITAALQPEGNDPLAAEYAALDEIDQRYAQLMNRPPEEWKLDDIARSYQQLAGSQSPRIAALVQQRLEIVAKRQEIATHYQNFQQVAGLTAARDAQLATGQIPLVAGPASSGGTPPLAGAGEPGLNPFLLGPAAAPGSALAGAAAGTFPGNSGPVVPTAGGSTPPQSPGNSPLTGAGMLQRVAGPDGELLFAAVSLEGKILSFLQPAEGVELSEWLDKPIGFVGERAFDPQLGVDKTVVRQVISVQLTR